MEAVVLSMLSGVIRLHKSGECYIVKGTHPSVDMVQHRHAIVPDWVQHNVLARSWYEKEKQRVAVLICKKS